MWYSSESPGKSTILAITRVPKSIHPSEAEGTAAVIKRITKIRRDTVKSSLGQVILNLVNLMARRADTI